MLQRIWENLPSVAGFSALWLGVGFALGTAVLLGPVRWVAGVLRWLGTSPALESFAVNGVIVGFVLASFLLTWVLFRWVGATSSTLTRVAVPGVTYAVAGLALWAWMSPAAITGAGIPDRKPEARFTLGPYPTERTMRQLRSSGFTGIVSLLHPSVVPFERKLLGDERALARELGLEFIHAPMLPWVSENEGALETIRKIAERDTGFYYVHCYLGRDRVGVAARMLRSLGYRVADWTSGGAGAGGGRADPARDLAVRDELARGPVHSPEDSVYVTPFPTEEEYFAYVFRGGVRSVVSILDPGVDRERAWSEWEEASVVRSPLDIRLLHLPVARFPPDPCALRAVVDSVRKLPRPVVVHGAGTEWTRSRMLLRAFRGDSLYPERYARGPVHWVGDSTYVGPSMTGGSFEDHLREGGLRAVVSVLDPGDSEEAALLEDARGRLRGSGILFRSVPLPAETRLAADAREVAATVERLPRPVYVLGLRGGEPRLAAVRAALAAAGFSPTCPAGDPPR